MADISKCIGEGCSKKDGCYRFTALASEFRQAYAAFNENLNEDGTCDYFLDNKV